MKKRKPKKKDRPLYDTIRKPTAPASQKFGSERREDRIDPVQGRRNTKREFQTLMPIFSKKKNTTPPAPEKAWARPEMEVTFRAEIMPGRDRDERTFRIKTVLRNGRVELHDFVGEHREGAFEPINFLRNKAR